MIAPEPGRVLPLIAPEHPDWPEPIEYLLFENLPVEKPRPLVEGVLDMGSRMIFGGGSKTYKTWAMSDMALSIATGVAWWAFKAFQARCVYVNFELKEYYMQKRLRAIRRAKGLTLAPGQLFIWNLRGYEITLEYFKECLLAIIREHGIAVVFIDPFYKLLGDRDERSSADLNPILVAFDEINRLTGCTIVFAAHFTKGNQAGKESLDRISGGGSIARDPDNLVTLTRHEEEHAFTVECTVRDFEPIAPFVVRWDYPLLVRTDLDPAKLKTAHRGRPSTCDPESLLEIIKSNDDELDTGALIEKAIAELGWSKRTVFAKLEVLKKQKRVYPGVATGNWNVASAK
jgi:hypothetical protein